MARTDRLFTLIQNLRGRRRPVTASDLAEELGVSKRTMHRDLDTLRALGAPIAGEAGIGYVLRPGFLLPPLMFTEDELDALALGALWVRQRGDPALSTAAGDALSKIAAVLPEAVLTSLDEPSLITLASPALRRDGTDAALVRKAVRERRKLAVVYASAEGNSTERVLWPLAIAYFENSRVLAAWCEKRQAFRAFRLDRMREVVVLDERYPGQRAKLLLEWKAQDRRADFTVAGN